MHRARDMIASAIRGARHYNGRLSQEPEQKSTVRRAFRQARQLAERQKAEDVKHQFNAPPPPPANKSWRNGSNFSRETRVFGHLRPSFGGGGVPLLDRYPREVPLSGRLRNPARLAAL